MRKKLKWLILLILFLFIAFAPLPFLHSGTFQNVLDSNGQETDYTIKITLFHFKPLFFDYGGSVFPRGHFCIGSVKVYERSSGKKVYTFSLDHDIYKDPDSSIFFSEMYDNPDTFTYYSGYLIWDDSFKNIILNFSKFYYNVEKNKQELSPAAAYLSSNENLTFQQLKELFESFESFYAPEQAK